MEEEDQEEVTTEEDEDNEGVTFPQGVVEGSQMMTKEGLGMIS